MCGACPKRIDLAVHKPILDDVTINLRREMCVGISQPLQN